MLKMKDSYILLGTGPWQRDFYQILRSTGVSVVTVGPSENIFGADHHINLDVKVVDQIETEVRKICNPIYFFTSQTDVSVRSAAELNYRCDISKDNLLASKVFTDKYLMRKKNNGIELKNPTHVKFHVHDLSFDLIKTKYQGYIVKPLHLQSSLGIKEITGLSLNDFVKYQEELYKLKVKEVIIEEKIEGIEYTIEGYKERSGDHKILAASKKEKKIAFGVANALHYAEEYLLDVVKLKTDLNSLFSDLSFGPTHTEVIKTVSGEFYLVEAAVRGGGSDISSKIIPSLTGFHPEIQMLQDSIGIKIPSEKMQRYGAVTLAFYAYKKSNNYKVDFSQIKSHIISHWTDYVAGRSLEKVFDDRSRHGCFIVGGDTTFQIQNILKQISDTNRNISLY